MQSQITEPTYKWTWHTGYIYPSQLLGGYSRGFESFGPIKSFGDLAQWLQHFRRKTWFTLGDERAIRGIAEEAGVY